MTTEEMVAFLRERGRGDIDDGYEDKTDRGIFDLMVADELERLLSKIAAIDDCWDPEFQR